jgi:hypothetical protein
MDAATISGANWDRCPFLSAVKRTNTKCVKNENAYGVCTINSVGDGARKDWLVCPYRVIDSEIVRSACGAIFGINPSMAPIPVSILNDQKGLTLLDESIAADQRAFVFFQDKLGGEISINGTPSSPEISFDITVVELSYARPGVIKVDRYGFIEIQTMDFHGSYKHAVSSLRNALDLHKRKFPTQLASNQDWASRQVEGPNIANVFKRTFYQTLLKFELSKEGCATGTVLALPEAVWESWQPFLGKPTIEQVSDSEFRLVGSDNNSYHGTNAWIFVFALDASAPDPISPVKITSRIRVSATDLVQHAFVTVPTTMLHRATVDDVLLPRIRERIRRAAPGLPVE